MTDKEIDNLLEEDSKTMLNDLRPKLKMQLGNEKVNISINKEEHELIQNGLAMLYNAIEKVAFEPEEGKLVGEGKEKEIKQLTEINELKQRIRNEFYQKINKENKSMVFYYNCYQENVEKLREKIVDAIKKGIEVLVIIEYEVQAKAFDKELFNEAYSDCVIEKEQNKGKQEYYIKPKK